MKTIQVPFSELTCGMLVIGFEGENNRAQVRIDCASVFEEYPHATPSLIVKPSFSAAYPVVVDRDGTDVVWLITSEILSFTGDGEIQLTFVKDQVICKSAIAKIRVCRSLQVTGDMPDPVAQWIDDANAKLAEVDAVIVSIDEMDAVASGLPEGTEPTVEVSMVDDHKRLSFGIPKGDKGDKGDTYELMQEDREEIAHIAEENFSDTVRGYRDDAMDAADRAEQSAQNAGYMFMEIVDGHLIFYRTENVSVADFSLVDGHLVMEVA